MIPTKPILCWECQILSLQDWKSFHSTRQDTGVQNHDHGQTKTSEQCSCSVTFTQELRIYQDWCTVLVIIHWELALGINRELVNICSAWGHSSRKYWILRLVLWCVMMPLNIDKTGFHFPSHAFLICDWELKKSTKDYRKGHFFFIYLLDNLWKPSTQP